MKQLVVIVMMVFSSSVFAQDKAADDFAKTKSDILSHIDKRLAFMQEHKACVSAAQNVEALKACRQKMRDSKMDMRMDYMGMKMDRMEMRKKRMKEKSSDTQ